MTLTLGKNLQPEEKMFQIFRSKQVPPSLKQKQTNLPAVGIELYQNRGRKNATGDLIYPK